MSEGPTRDEILVLRCIAFGDSSKIVSALSARWGKIRLVAKGARSLRSRLAGLLEPGNEVEAVFYPREGRDLWIISDGALRRAALTGASSLDKLSHLFAALELGDRLLPDLDGAAEFEPHFRQFLDRWHEGEDAAMASLFFALELRMLEESGWGVDIGSCAQCGNALPVADGEGRAYWLASEGHLNCAGCAGHGGRWIDIQVVHALAAIDGLGLGAIGEMVPLSSIQRRGVGRLLHEHMSYHLPQYRLPKSLYWLQDSRPGTAAEAR
jgi:DNA repair protein RecO